MIEVEFIAPFKCYKKGDTKKVYTHFAQVLIEQGLAKVVKKPQKHKMILEPEMEK